MLNLFKLAFALERRQSPAAMRRQARTGAEPIGAISLETRPELRIRNLLEDPALRRAMGLDASVTELPKRRRPSAEPVAA